MSSAPSQPAPATASSNRLDVQIGLLFAVVVITAIATLTVTLLFPEAGEGGFFSYESVEPDRAFFWGFLTLVAVNVVLTIVAAALVGRAPHAAARVAVDHGGVRAGRDRVRALRHRRRRLGDAVLLRHRFDRARSPRPRARSSSR